VPDRVETGTQNHEGIAGVRATVDFLASIGTGTTRRSRLQSAYASLHERSATLFARLWDGLGAIVDLERFGPPPARPRTPTVSVEIAGQSPPALAARMSERGLFLSHGDYYAATVAERYGRPDGFLRVGLSAYSTSAEVDRLLEAMSELARGR
jgi:selenocysteine lyase/cysteine desulfurase